MLVKFYSLMLGLTFGFYRLPAVFAQSPAEPSETILEVNPALGPDSVDFTWLFLKTLLAMAVVLGLAIVVLRFVLPHLGLHRPQKSQGNFRVLESFPLDAKKSLYVVEVEGRRFLIGSSEHAINLVSELDRQSSSRDS